MCNKQKDQSSKSSCLPVRYRLALTASVATIIHVAIRKSVALVLTHITASDVTATSEDIVFANCTVFNTSRDLHIEMGEDTMFLLHSINTGGYALSRIPAVVLAHWASPARVISACLGVSSLLTMCLPSVITASIPLLFVLRGIQGVLDGAVFPCVLGILACWTTEADSGRVYSLACGGSFLAPAISAVLSGCIMCYVNWNGSLYILGSFGLAWALLWTLTAYNTPEEHPSLPPAERDLHQKHRAKIPLHCKQAARSIPWRQILTSLPVWSVFVAFFSRHFVYNLIMVAQPQYFMDAFGINIADISLLTTIPHVGLSLISMLGGVIVDMLVKKGLSTTLTRKIVFTCGHLSEGLCLIGLYFTDDWKTAITLISMGVSVGGVADSGYFPLPADLSPTHAGVISGIGATGIVGSFFSSISAALLCGKNQGLAGWRRLYLMAGLISSSSVLFFNIWAQAKLQPWAHQTDSKVLETDERPPRASETDRLLPEPSETNELKAESARTNKLLFNSSEDNKLLTESHI